MSAEPLSASDGAATTGRGGPVVDGRAGPGGGTEALRFSPAVRAMWRTSERLQLELAGRAVVVDGLHPDTVARLSGRADARPAAEDGSVIRVLERAGFVTRHDPQRAAARDARTAVLAPDREALHARYGPAAEAVIERRRHCGVTLFGRGRLPAVIASLLAAGGIGRIDVQQSGDVALRDAMPGGLRPEDEGRRASTATAEAVRRAAPSADTSPADRGASDLIVVTTGSPVPRELRTIVTTSGTPHLITGVWAGQAVIGPLVVPGRTSCLACADRHRRDRDPAWPALAVQLAARSPERDPSEIAVCALAAALTCVQALAHLDGDAPAAADGTLELRLPDWRVRRRSWPRHPDCPCATTGSPG